VELMFVDHKVFGRPSVYLYAIVAFNIVSEGNILINRYFEKKEPWVLKVSSRIIKQVFLSLVWTSLIGILFYYLIPSEEEDLDKYSKGFVLTFTFGALFVLIYNSILFIQSFIANWKVSMLENEKLKREKLKSDYTALQNQLNPHFLFNNLSVLISEIRYESNRAEEFARKMADIYRYVLQSKDKTLVQVREELKFIENYVFLHNIRLGNAVKLEVVLSGEELDESLPPLTLQLLVENALKHNKASEKEPLNIKIFKEDGDLVVSNNLQLKRTTYSTGTGLTNLNERYKLLYGKEVTIENLAEEFRVLLPME
jgi:LytS/YehU family sensor histidine kinase